MGASPPDLVSATHREARLFWPRVWIYAGFSAVIPEAGDILPFTIADAGLHVERLADGGLAARLNRAQQGGCLTIPQQCHSGAQLRCPQTACAFSRDRLPVIDAGTPERDRLLHQFLGSRPDRLAAVALREEGGFIRILMRDDDAAEAAQPAPHFPAEIAESWWVEATLPWQDLAQSLAQAGAFHFPNLVMLAHDGWRAVVILQPLGPKLTRCRVTLAGGGPGDRRAVDTLLARAAQDVVTGEAAAFSLRGEIDRLCRTPWALSASRSAGRRPNPAFGFIGG